MMGYAQKGGHRVAGVHRLVSTCRNGIRALLVASLLAVSVPLPSGAASLSPSPTPAPWVTNCPHSQHEHDAATDPDWRALHEDVAAACLAFWEAAVRLDGNDVSDLLAAQDTVAAAEAALAILDEAGIRECWADWWTVQRAAYVLAYLGPPYVMAYNEALAAGDPEQTAQTLAGLRNTVKLVYPVLAAADWLAEEVDCAE